MPGASRQHDMEAEEDRFDSEPAKPIRSQQPDEHTALLLHAASEDVESGFTFTKDEGLVKSVSSELLVHVKGAIPVFLAYALQNSLQTVSVLIVGRLSARSLATASFSYMFAMSTGWLIALGGTTAIDTLASTSYTGSKNPHDLGIILQRAFVVLGLFFIPVAVTWFLSEPLFIALKQEPWLARDSRNFLCILAPGGLGYIYFECMKKFLQAQEIMRPGTYVLLITSPLNALLNWLLVYPAGLGLMGAPLATGISYWLSFILLVMYTRFFRGSRCWGGWSRACLNNIWPFTRMALLGIVQVGSEWWAFEIVALVAGHLGTIPLAAQSVIMNTDQIMNTLPFGIGVAASSRIGNLLGSRAATRAKHSAHAAALLSITAGAVVLAFLMAVKDFYAKIFNDNVDVIKLTAEVMPLVALFQIADGLNGSCGGVLRGQGRQHVAAAVNVVSYYFIALPLGIYLAYHRWGLKGLWVGQCLALYLVGFIQWGIVSMSNWDQQVERALQRLEGRRRSSFAGGQEQQDSL